MRRPTRTRRLSIAALTSLLAFVVAGGAGIRSLWIADAWNAGDGRGLGLFGGRVTYKHDPSPPFVPSGHISFDASMISPSRRIIGEAIWGFGAGTEVHSLHSRTTPSVVEKVFYVTIPLWPFLLLLLIAPVRWLIARPANAPAFPVIAATTGKARDV